MSTTTKKRVTIKRVNTEINPLGFELQRGNGYYYFTRTSNESPVISEDGLYGSSSLNAWTLEQIVNTLKERITESS